MPHFLQGLLPAPVFWWENEDDRAPHPHQLAPLVPSCPPRHLNVLPSSQVWLQAWAEPMQGGTPDWMWLVCLEGTGMHLWARLQPQPLRSPRGSAWEAAPPFVLTQGPGLEPSVFTPGGRVLGWAGGAHGLGAGLRLYKTECEYLLKSLVFFLWYHW